MLYRWVDDTGADRATTAAHWKAIAETDTYQQIGGSKDAAAPQRKAAQMAQWEQRR
jgi:hypothetical protein